MVGQRPLHTIKSRINKQIACQINTISDRAFSNDESIFLYTSSQSLLAWIWNTKTFFTIIHTNTVMWFILSCTLSPPLLQKWNSTETFKILGGGRRSSFKEGCSLQTLLYVSVYWLKQLLGRMHTVPRIAVSCINLFSEFPISQFALTVRCYEESLF